MKQLIIAAFIVISSATGLSAQTWKMSSVYTSLSDKVCKTLKVAANEGEEYSGLCKMCCRD